MGETMSETCVIQPSHGFKVAGEGHYVDAAFTPTIGKTHTFAAQQISVETPKSEASFGARDVRIVNLASIFLLFVEIMKLMIEQRKQERLERLEERAAQIEHMEAVVANLKQQSKWILYASLSSGVLGIAAGALPIIGHMKGDWILNKFSSLFPSLKDMKPNEFFKNMSKMTHTMSETQKNIKDIQQTKGQAEQAYDQGLQDLARTDGEECTRTLSEILEEFRQLLRIWDEMRQQENETASKLYR